MVSAPAHDRFEYRPPSAGKLCIVALLMAVGFAVAATTRAFFSKDLRSATPDHNPRFARLSPNTRVRASGISNTTMGLRDGYELPSAYVGAVDLTSALERNVAEPRSLASADFDEDGVPDLMSGFVYKKHGIVTLRRGNGDAIYPNAPEAQQRRREGTFTDAPFLAPVHVFRIPIAVDFIGTGDFDSDGHWDVVAASRSKNSLYLLCGDGHGDFSTPREIHLPGVVTAMTTGEINRRDGLTDIVIGVAGLDGSKVMVFEGPEGALRGVPEVFDMPTQVSSLALGQLNGDFIIDLAVAAGSELLIITGRDRKLSLAEDERRQVGPAKIRSHRFSSVITALAIGDFIESPQDDLGVLLENDTVRILTADTLTSGDEHLVGTPAQAKASNYETARTATGTHPRTLLSAYVSGSPKDDLVIVDRLSDRLQIVTDRQHDLDSSQADKTNSSATETHLLTRELITAKTESIAILPMRLDRDALSDLVVFSKNADAPSVILTDQGAKIFADQPNSLSQSGKRLPATACARTPITVGTVINGELAAGDCKFTTGEFLDAYSFVGARDQYVSVTMNSTAFDTYVDLVAPDGLLMKYDGFNTAQHTSHFVFGLPEDGTYSIRASSYLPDTTGTYTLETAFLTATSKTFIVVNANDAGTGSLRQAILNANDNVGPDTIVFSIQSGPQTIALQSVLPEITDVVTIDGTTQPGFSGKPIVEVTGGGFFITSGRSVIRGLVLNRPDPQDSIQIYRNNGNIIEGNFIGTDATGTVSLGNNAIAVDILSSHNILGGTALAARNVLGAVTVIGGDPQILDTDNVVQGNFIGTDFTGHARLLSSNTFAEGIEVQSPYNLIGGTEAGAGNLISGHGYVGLRIVTAYALSPAEHNLVQGNLIGPDVTGTAALTNLPQAPGISLSGGDNIVGGTTIAARNLISGNGTYGGISIGGQAGNLVQGNFIGTDISGTRALANTGDGVAIQLGNGNLIGGSLPAARNVISGNGGSGVSINGFSFPGGGGTASNNRVFGNFIGVDAAGANAIGNQKYGVQVTISGSVANDFIGGTSPGEGNVISANNLDGVAIGIKFVNNEGKEFTGGTGIVIQSNSIGTDASGTHALGNGGNGIFVDADSFTNTIKDNSVAFNSANGIFLPNNGNPAVRILMDGNAVFHNNGLGIDLGDAGITPNDAQDTDVGANLQQNFPVLTSAVSSVTSGETVWERAGEVGREMPDPVLAAALTINGTLNSTPNATFTVHWYFSADGQCTTNQAATRPLASGKVPNVVTNGNGDAQFSFPFDFPVGVNNGIINCTATDAQGNTSEFSSCIPVNSATPNGPTIFVETGTNNLAAVDSVSLTRAPFALTNAFNYSSDHRTRIVFFTTDLGFAQSTQPNMNTLSVQVGGNSYTVESVGPNSTIGGSAIVFRLPDLAAPGTYPLGIRLNGVNSTNAPNLQIVNSPGLPGSAPKSNKAKLAKYLLFSLIDLI